MKVSAMDIHGSHGLSFTLQLAPNTRDDKSVLKMLEKLLRKFKNNTHAGLHVYDLNFKNGIIDISLVETSKNLAKINHLWNLYREDQKFVVLEVHEDPRNNPTGDDTRCPHYICHICGTETWGVSRDTMEVFNKEENGLKLVSVHDKCKLNRLREVETAYAGV